MKYQLTLLAEDTPGVLSHIVSLSADVHLISIPYL